MILKNLFMFIFKFNNTPIKLIKWLIAFSIFEIIILAPLSSYVPILPLIKKEWGINNFQSGSIYSAYLIGYAFSSLIILPFADKFDTRKVFLLSCTLFVCSHLAFALFAINLILAWIIFLFSGAGLLGIYMIGIRIISDQFEENIRGTAIGLFVSANYASMSVSIFLIGNLLNYFEWRNAYLIVSIISATGLPIAFILLSNIKSNNNISLSNNALLDFNVLKISKLRNVILTYSLHTFELYSVKTWFIVFLTSIFVSRMYSTDNAVVISSNIAGIGLGFSMLGPVFGGYISDRFGRLNTSSILFICSGICSLIVGWVGNFDITFIILFAILYYFFLSSDSAIYSTMITEFSGKKLGSAMA
ncbi:MAG: hypothetical protein CL758_08380, partial [Chloroflexi bacterium]|nr:hypothetical protein [Chloroflexota bacterium]